MPFLLTPEPQGMWTRFSGHVTTAEFLQATLANHKRPEFDDSWYVIHDYSAATSFAINLDEIKLAAVHSAGAFFSNPDVLLAGVTTDPGLLTLMPLFAQITRYPTRCFATLEQAREWITENKPQRRGRVSTWTTLK